MDATVIDLVALGAAASPLADWWEHFATSGQAEVGALDAARKQLATVATVPGRVGQAIRLIVDAPADVLPVALTLAIELVAHTARRCPSAKVRQTRARRRTTRRDALCGGVNQLALPGFGDDLGLEPGPAPPSA